MVNFLPQFHIFFTNQFFIWLLSVPWKCLTTASHFKSDALNVCWMFWLHCSSSNFYFFYTQFVSYYPVLILIMLLNDDILDAYIWLKILYSTSLFPLSLSTARYRYIFGRKFLRPKGQTTLMAFFHFIYFSFILSLFLGEQFPTWIFIQFW